MLKTLISVMALWLVAQTTPGLAQSSAARDPRTIVRSALKAMGGESKLRAIKRIQFEGMRHQNLLEQSERPEGPWLVDYREFSEFHDLENSRLRLTSKSRGILGTNPAPVSVITADGVSAYEFNGRFIPAPASEVQEAQVSQALLPDRALLSALEARDLSLESHVTLQGVNQHVVAFTRNEVRFRVFLNANTALPTAVELISDYPYHAFWSVWGDTPTRVYYSTWMIEPNGIRYPHQFDLMRQDLPYQSTALTKLTINPDFTEKEFSIPPEIKESFDKSKLTIDELPLGWRGRSKPEELAHDVVKIPAGWDVALVRQSDGLVVIEAPLSSGYSAKVMTEAERRFPGVPIKAVVTTSDAWPHIGGIREYVSSNIPIYALDLNESILRRVVAAPRQFHRDALAKNPRRPRSRLVRAKTAIGVGPNRIELYPIRGEGSERMLMVYLPEHHLLYGSDLVQVMPDGSFFMPQYLSELMDAVRREKLSVETVFAVHAGATAWTKITTAVAHAEAGSK